MAQIGILTGIYATTGPDLARSYPINLDPVVEPLLGDGTGISKGYLRLSHGIQTKALPTGQDRGGRVWQGTHYRVCGSTLYTVDEAGALTVVGDVGAGGPVGWAESFDRLAIRSGDKLWYWTGTALTQVTDPDLGAVNSLAWSDGYFLTTDGTSIVATELNDPAAVDPLKYGSSEADPDPVVGLLALRGTVYALNRHSIEAFQNTGGTGFPFRRNRGSEINKGAAGPDAFCPFVETFAFCGSGRNETPGVYLAGAGQAVPISPRALNDELAALSDTDLASVRMEQITVAGQLRLMVHLPARTWVYHWTASQAIDLPVWSILAGGLFGENPYPARGFVWFDNRWWCGGNGVIGTLDADTPTLFAEKAGYRFDTPLVYNEGMGAIIHALELVTLAGRTTGPEPQVSVSLTDDGLTYTPERPASVGRRGERNVRPAWRRLGRMRHWRGFRFRGVAEAPVAFTRLEATLEPLNG
jgi:hypothetical protein